MTTLIDLPAPVALQDAPLVVTSEIFTLMVEREVFPRDCRVFLWDGRLYEKMVKSKPQAAVQNAFLMAITRRLP